MNKEQEKQLTKDLESQESIDGMLSVLRNNFALDQCRPSSLVKSKVAAELCAAMKKLDPPVLKNSNMDLIKALDETKDKGLRQYLSGILSTRS